MPTVTEDLPDLYRLLNIPGRRSYALLEMDESLSTELSDDLIFNWHEYVAKNPQPIRIERLAWDLYRRCGKQRGYEFFITLLEGWEEEWDYDELQTFWASCDRPENADDLLILDDLARIHHTVEGGLAALYQPEDGEDVRNELEALADIFDRVQVEAAAARAAEKESASRYARQEWMRDDAEEEWLAFNGSATAEQAEAFQKKYQTLMIPFTRKLEPLTIIPFPLPPITPNPPGTAALRLTFFDECAERSPKNWIFKGVFAKGENSSIFGAPGTLKSAFLTDAAVHAASGKDWRGFKSKGRCGVVYFAFERADQVRRRLAAYTVRDKLKALPIAVADNIIDMLNPACVDIVVATIRDAEAQFDVPVGLIVFDTWSKGIAAGGGDEDKAKDQNMIAANLRRIHEVIKVHIAGIGHSGKDETRGERGSNARQGDVDLQIQITGSETKTATVIKANDQPEGALTSFSGEVVSLGADEDGDPISAFIVSARHVAPAPTPTSKLSDRQVLALDALRAALNEKGSRVDGVQKVEVETWREMLFSRGVLDRDAGNPRSAFKKLKDALARSKRIIEQDDFVQMGYATPMMSMNMTTPPPPPSHSGN